MGGFLSSEEKPVPVVDPNLLYTPAGAACSFQDRAYFTWRIHQMELLNHVIRKMSKVLCLSPDSIDYRRLIEDVMSYKTIDDQVPEGDDYNFDILAKDKTFKGPAETMNKFAEFQEYMSTKGGRSPQQMKSDMLEYLDVFVRLRSALTEALTDGCK